MTVRIKTPTQGPDVPRSPKEALQANPASVVVDKSFTTKRAAREAAGRVNLGKRKEWPNTTYYAAWEFDVATGKWDVWIGLRSHMPEGWRRFVEGNGRRLRRTRATQGSTPAETE